MYWRLLQIATTMLSSPIPAVLPSWLILVSALAGPLLGWFGALSTRGAPLQLAINDAFRSAMAEWQLERVQLTARISEIMGEIADMRMTLLERDGEIRQLKSARDALTRALEKEQKNVEIPD